MSEERERNIAFSQSLKSALKLRGHGDCTDEESKFFTSGFIAGEKFASQVCEQREKEPRVDIKWLGEQLKKEAGIAIAYERGTRNPTGASDGTYAKLTVQNKRAEAAELALHNEIVRWQKRIYDVCRKVYAEVDGAGCDSGDELDFSIDEIEQTFAHLQNALQSKEQELAALVETLKATLHVQEHEHTRIMESWAKQSDADHQAELAQARQQAVAECARIVFDEGYEAVAHRLRSLTPPPALTCKHLERWEHANGTICKQCGATLGAV